jgi:hypothetical protein
MKLIKNAKGKTVLKLSKREWLKIGGQQGWSEPAERVRGLLSSSGADILKCLTCGEPFGAANCPKCDNNSHSLDQDDPFEIIDPNVECEACHYQFNSVCPKCGGTGEDPQRKRPTETPPEMMRIEPGAY